LLLLSSKYIARQAVKARKASGIGEEQNQPVSNERSLRCSSS
jgi:hypothetical protein